VTTSSADNLPRDDRGKWKRQLANVERDAEAARLAAQGWSYSRIAQHLGYSDKGDAWRGSRRALAELAQAHGADELRQQQITSNKELRARMWAILDSPPPLTDRVGRVVHDDDGRVVPDTQALIGAATTILKADERLGRLVGLDAPRRSVTMSIDQGLEQIREQYIQQKGYDPFAPETKEAYRAWLEDDQPLELGGTLRMSRLSEMPEDEREDILSQIRDLDRRHAVEAALQDHQASGRKAIPGQVMTDDA
jgi:hypothetical protein